MLNATGAILAGGRSRRMGTNKALVELVNCNLVEQLVKEFVDFSPELVLVTNEKKPYRYLGLKISSLF